MILLEEDVEILRQKRQELYQRYTEAAKASGEACTQSSETFHDNFPYEQAMRDMQMYNDQVQEINEMLHEAQIVPGPDPTRDEVQVGSIVHILDLDTDEYSFVKVAGYVNLAEDTPGTSWECPIRVSYHSPCGKALMGLRRDDCGKISIPKQPDKNKLFIVVDIRNNPPI